MEKFNETKKLSKISLIWRIQKNAISDSMTWDKNYERMTSSLWREIALKNYSKELTDDWLIRPQDRLVTMHLTYHEQHVDFDSLRYR